MPAVWRPPSAACIVIAALVSSRAARHHPLPATRYPRICGITLCCATLRAAAAQRKPCHRRGRMRPDAYDRRITRCDALKGVACSHMDFNRDAQVKRHECCLSVVSVSWKVRLRHGAYQQYHVLRVSAIGMSRKRGVKEVIPDQMRLRAKIWRPRIATIVCRAIVDRGPARPDVPGCRQTPRRDPPTPHHIQPMRYPTEGWRIVS